MKYRYSILQYNIGNYEKIKEIENPQDDVEYILVVDDPTITSKTYKVICDDSLSSFSTFEKCFLIRYNVFKYCTTDICVSIDCNTKILKSIDSLVQKFIDGNYDICLMPHPSRNNFIDEIHAWFACKPTYEKEFGYNAIEFLKKSNYDLSYKSLFQTSFTIKRKNKDTSDINRMVYALLKHFGYSSNTIDKDDQIAFSYVLNRYYSHYKVLPVSEQIISSDYLQACMHGTNDPIPKNYLTYYQRTHDDLSQKDMQYVFNSLVECEYLI